MEIPLIWSSPDTDGLTARAKDAVARGISRGGASVREVHLNRLDIRLCRACGPQGWGICRTEHRCALDDDMNEIYGMMKSSPVFALVTPVYWHDMSENLKALLDRVRRCDAKRAGAMIGKRYLAVACAGGTGRGVVRCLESIGAVMTHMGVEASDRLPVTRASAEYMMPALESAGLTLSAFAQS